MYLQRLYLRNFRVFEEISFDFCNGINNFYGSNAQGKTTILEAVHFLITGRSFRTAQLTDLIKDGKEFFYLEALFSKEGIAQKLKASWDGKSRRIFHNQTELASTSGLLGILQGVVMTPDDIGIIKGAPAGRRALLDLQIAQIDPLYVHHLTRYNRAIKHRNTLLRSKRLESIEGWEQEMSNSAAYIILQRSRILEELQAASNRIHALLTDHHQNLSFFYSNDFKQFQDLETLRQKSLSQWQQFRRREMDIGFTIYGPHKDDFTIGINGKEARFFSSEGQQRSCVTALRLAEWETMKNRVEDLPLMLIDDLGISLDETRRKNLNTYIEKLEQVFITSTDNLQFEKEQRSFFIIY